MPDRNRSLDVWTWTLFSTVGVLRLRDRWGAARGLSLAAGLKDYVLSGEQLHEIKGTTRRGTGVVQSLHGGQ
jgi:hypothetical protein